MYKRSSFSLSRESISTLASDETEGEEAQIHSRTSFGSGASDDGHPAQAADGFFQDASNSIYESLQQAHDVSTIQLELQGLRMSANASEHQVRHAVVTGLTRFILDKRQCNESIKNILLQNKTLVERTIFDTGGHQASDQADFLLLTQSELSKHPQGDVVLASICNDLYLMDDFDEDLFEAEAFQQWWANPKSTGTEAMRNVRERTQKFMDVLDEDEEDDESDDESDDD